MAHKLMYTNNDAKQNYPFYRYQLVVETFEPTNQNVMIVPKVVSQRIRKLYYKTLGTCVKDSANFYDHVILFLLWVLLLNFDWLVLN